MRETPKPRQMEILRLLLMSGMPLDIEFLKGKLQKSERTIRYDIQELKDLCAPHQIEIRYLKKTGYYIPAGQKASCSALMVRWSQDAKEGFVDEEEEQRLNRIFSYLFVRKEYVTAEKLADVYFASRSTLARSLGRIEAHFGNSFTLDVKKAQGYRMTGNEMEIRRQAVKLLTARFKGSYTADDWYLLLPDELKIRLDLEDIREISRNIRRLNGKYNIWISNTAYLNLMSYCVARLLRLPLLKEEKNEDLSGEENYVQELLREVSPQGKGRTRQELAWLTEFLMEQGIYVEEYRVDEELLQRILDRIMNFVESRKDWGHFDFQSLRQDLEEHLKNYLNLSREERQEEENEYVLNEIQGYYYSHFQMAVQLAEIIEEETGQELNIMEVCYLAVYLYKNGIQPENERRNVMVVCATGKGLSHFLTLRIKHVFPMLNVVGQVSPYQLSKATDLKNVDFAISTVPLENSLVPVVKISGALLAEDIQRIQEFLKYGKLIDDIPFGQKEQASFQSKDESSLTSGGLTPVSDGSLAEAAGTMSRLILMLLEHISKLPPQVCVSQDTMLGMVIHMSMAVQRWLTGDVKEDAAEDYLREYSRVGEKYPDVFLVMDKFFGLAEKTLQVRIPIAERVAFFLYIIEEE